MLVLLLGGAAGCRSREKTQQTMAVSSTTRVACDCMFCGGDQYVVVPGFGGASPTRPDMRWVLGESQEDLEKTFGPCEMVGRVCRLGRHSLEVELDGDARALRVRQSCNHRWTAYAWPGGAGARVRPICDDAARFGAQVPLSGDDLVKVNGEPLERRVTLDREFGVIERWTYVGVEYDLDAVDGELFAGAATIGPLTPWREQEEPNWWRGAATCGTGR